MFGVPFAIYYFHNSDAIKNGGVHCFANADSQTPVSGKTAGAVDITQNFDEYIREYREDIISIMEKKDL